MPITVYQDRVFLLHTKAMSYVFRVDEDGLVRKLYWGNRIDRAEDFAAPGIGENFSNSPAADRSMEECSSFGGMRFKETSLKVTFGDGVRDFRYRVGGYRIEGNHLCVTLEDIRYAFCVRLHYRVYDEHDIIEKWREAENLGEEELALERFYSSEFALPGTDYEAVNCNGRWGAEFKTYSEPVGCGKKVYESLRGFTGHTVSPFFAVHRNADEDRGEVYYGTLGYSGNFKVVVEATPYEFVNILMGISDTDFKWKLRPREVFETPSVYAGYTSEGFGAMSNTLARFARAEVMPKALADRPLPVLFNSWYATLFDVACDQQIALAEQAAQIGVELFVVDDGWFAGRKSDKAGLGDWWVDREKFPDGLAPLIRRVNELGMQFGIWIEPEMVNPDSDLYRKRPDWIYRYETREVLMGRNQYMLDLTNPEVTAYLTAAIDRLLTENRIAYVKWDMNRCAAEMASSFREPDEYKTMWHRNTEGFYTIIRALREKHPGVEFEACASGGGRVDFGAMAHFDEYWPSDNTDPLDRLFIQEGYSLVYPVKYMRAWLTADFGMNSRNTPLQFGMHCAMCGALGIGMDLSRTGEEELALLKRYVEEYKAIRETVQLGSLYRLKSLRKDDIHAVQYVNGLSSAVFVFLDHERYGKRYYRLRLKGLDPSAAYRYTLRGRGGTRSGAYLMNEGLELELRGDYDSALILLTGCG